MEPEDLGWVSCLAVTEVSQGSDFADVVATSVKRINVKTSFHEGEGSKLYKKEFHKQQLLSKA